MNKLILHIPHSSVFIPSREGFVVSEKILIQEINRFTDWYTDELFYSEEDTIVKAEFSRLFCDVERFVDDKYEVMASKGMGVLYTHLDSGEPLRNVTPDFKAKILNAYYFPHHKNLTEAVEIELAKNGNALIVDCHSFPNIPFKSALDQNTDRPDFNIGTDRFHTPSDLSKKVEDFILSSGYTVLIDKPYSGTIVPEKFFGKERRLMSIMIEVNRKLYMDEVQFSKNQQFENITKLCSQILDLVRSYSSLI